MEQPSPSRHRRRERRRDRPTPPAAAPPVETADPPVDAAAAPVAPPVHAVGTAPAADAAGDPPAVEDVTSPAYPAATKAAGGEVAEGPPAARRKPRTRRTDAERSLRGIVGAGSSQVGVVGAMRARDAARPTAEDLAAAERDLVIVRRHYVPPDNLPGAVRPAARGRPPEAGTPAG